MSTQVRILFIGAILALLLGWLGLRQGNRTLAARLASAPAAAGERAP